MLTVLLIPVPQVEITVGKLRNKYDRSSHLGIPSHITVLFPFMQSERIDNKVINQLKLVFGNIRSFEYKLSKVFNFPGVIYLQPNPRQSFIKLTKEVFKLFPKYPPYEGKFPKINPHLTLVDFSYTKKAVDNFDKIKYEIKKDMALKLPIKTTANCVWLMERRKTGQWHIHTKFKFSN